MSDNDLTDIRCGSCRKKLGVGTYIHLQIKCQHSMPADGPDDFLSRLVSYVRLKHTQ